MAHRWLCMSEHISGRSHFRRGWSCGRSYASRHILACCSPIGGHAAGHAVRVVHGINSQAPHAAGHAVQARL